MEDIKNPAETLVKIHKKMNMFVDSLKINNLGLH